MLFSATPASRAQTQPATLWTGPNIEFTQSATNLVDVLVPSAVSLTRDYDRWLFNPAGGDTGPAPGTPSDTLWAFGVIENYQGLDYQTFDSYRDGDLSSLLIGNPMVVQLVNEQIYLSLTFSAWPQHGGFFAYTRSTPAPVTITNPPDGSVFAIPVNVNIDTVVTDSAGPVTNVAFYANSTSLGTVQSAPFSVNTGNLAAGAYALTAVATAGGVFYTSTVVNINLVVPVAIDLSSETITNGQFSFNYTANPGLTYVVQNSSNLVNWVSVATNVPTTNAASFADTFYPAGSFFYRVLRLPNP